MALLVGALYAGSRGENSQAAVADRTGALFFVLINQAFSAMAPLRVFRTLERPLSRSHRFWLLPWDRLIIPARGLEIETQKSLASTRTTSC
jgi:hypothetical protein